MEKNKTKQERISGEGQGCQVGSSRWVREWVNAAGGKERGGESREGVEVARCVRKDKISVASPSSLVAVHGNSPSSLSLFLL